MDDELRERPADEPALADAVVPDEALDEDSAPDLDTVVRERDEYLADLQRLKAEFDNFRKRSMREGAVEREAGTARVVSSMLDVLDDFELAVLATESSQDIEGLRRGVEIVYGKLRDVLRGFGLERLGEKGEPFDLVRHDAVQFEGDAEGAEQIGSALLHVREGSDEDLEAVEECLADQ